jgi:FkbM family methyltransferase
MLRGLGLRRASWKVARMCGYLPPFVLVEKRVGKLRLKFKMLSASGFGGVPSQYWLGEEYERGCDTLFALLASNSVVVVDVGAAGGTYTLLSGACPAVREVHSYEPYPPAYQRLVANVDLNKLTQKVRMWPLAVAERSGTRSLFIPERRFETLEASSSLNPAFRTSHDSEISVSVVTLDEHLLCRSTERIGAIKIDAESAEPQVLHGARQILIEHRPFVVCEVLANANAEDMNTLISELRYQALVLKGRNVLPTARLAPSLGNPIQLLCPKERLAELNEMIRIGGFRVRAEEPTSHEYP